MSYWKDGDYYRAEEIPAENFERWHNFLDDIRTFIKNSPKIRVVPTNDILKLGKEKFEFFSENLGKEAIASILVASEHRALLYSDDLPLRFIAYGWKVQGVWSQAVLMSMRFYHAIADEEYYDAISQLVLANYRMVFVDAPALMRVLKKNDMKLSDEVARIFGYFQGPNYEEDDAIGIMAELIRRVWLEPLLYQQKLSILDLILKSLVTGRLQVQVVFKLKLILRKKFKLMLPALQIIFENIELWQKQKSLKGGLLL